MLGAGLLWFGWYGVNAGSATSSNGEVSNWWNNIYQMLNRANDVIANVPQISMDTAARNDIVGNARFLRALGYFELIRSFGDVPLLLTPTTANSNLLPAKTPVAQIYPQIISDLQQAKSMLGKLKVQGHPNIYSASAILADVYLTMAGWPLNDASKYALSAAEALAPLLRRSSTTAA